MLQKYKLKKGAGKHHEKIQNKINKKKFKKSQKIQKK